MYRINRQEIYKQTGAGYYYDRQRKSWCALWLGAGAHQYTLWVNPKYQDTTEIIRRINEIKSLPQNQYSLLVV